MPAPSPVSGGGAMSVTVSRVRWGRLFLVVVGVALVGVGGWAALHGSGSTAAPADSVGISPTVSGGGTSDAKSGTDARVTIGTPKVVAPKVASAKVAAIRTAAARKAAARRAAARRVAARAAAVAPMVAAAPRVAAAATSAPTTAGATATGGGTAGQLPYTGAASWIAAIIGLIALMLGILVHINAVRIGMTALLYRRGILLRPTDLARLAHRRGTPQARILLSNALHRLLEVPASSDEFVTARHA
ncbi:MAG: hypothetical protein H7287_13775 [Thermoleophilia bacterium]|nr:hypothetical protein [Thermoleophilia bacterium]